MDNISQQADELEALQSIFEDDWVYQAELDCYCIQIDKNTELTIKLNPDYPSDKPPKYELLAPLLTGSERKEIDDEFENIYQNEKGGPIIYQWIEKLKEVVSRKVSATEVKNCNNTDHRKAINNIVNSNIELIKEFEAKVTHGSPIVDRKSVFQGHACKVESPDDVQNFKEYLLQNKKIAQATHNISAYRIKQANKKIVLQDCDDDGEAYAGGRLLHLLEILNLENVMVVVSRWYGGTLLGPDRFKHINNGARQVLVEAGFLKS